MSDALARARMCFPNALDSRAIAALALPGEAPGSIGPGSAVGPAGSRAGSPAPPRSLGALGRDGGHGRLLVEPHRLVGPSRIARSRGTMLRCLGRLGLSLGRASLLSGLCTCPVAYR